MILNRRVRAAVLAFAPLLLWGCGYVGEPLPPLMNVPARGQNLTAVQRGSTIIAHLTLPTLTTEGVVIKQGLRLDLRIAPKPAAPFNPDAWAAAAQSVGGGTTAKGITEFHIPAAAWIGKQVLLAVKIVGANGRDAGWSVPAEIAVVPPPEQPRDLTAVAVPQGVGLTWRAPGSSFVIMRRGPAEPDYQVIAQSPQPEYIDATAQFGMRYSYLVQSVTKAGDGQAQSEPSNEAAIAPLDTFPPAAPAGLTAVPSTASVELVWERSISPGVVGYRVYRALGNSSFERLSDTQTLPAYSDRKIASGKIYRYAVSAVKQNQAESKTSEPVEVTAP